MRFQFTLAAEGISLPYPVLIGCVCGGCGSYKPGTWLAFWPSSNTGSGGRDRNVPATPGLWKGKTSKVPQLSK
jgi:hypothetical protein